jgi:hypothetical protein
VIIEKGFNIVPQTKSYTYTAPGTLDSSVLYPKSRTATHRALGGMESRVEVIKWLFPPLAARLSKKLKP